MTNELKADILSFDIMEESTELEMMIITEAYTSESYMTEALDDIKKNIMDKAKNAEEKAKDTADMMTVVAKNAVASLKDKTEEIIEKIKEFFKKIIDEVRLKMEQRSVKKKLKNLAEAYAHGDRKSAKYCNLKLPSQEYSVTMKRFNKFSDAMVKLYHEMGIKKFNTVSEMDAYFDKESKCIYDDFLEDFKNEDAYIKLRIEEAIKQATDIVSRIDENLGIVEQREIDTIEKIVSDYEKYCNDEKKVAAEERVEAIAKMGAIKRTAIKAQTMISSAGQKFCTAYAKHPFIYTTALAAAIAIPMEVKISDDAAILGATGGLLVGIGLNAKGNEKKINKSEYEKCLKRLKDYAHQHNSSQEEIEYAVATLRKMYKQ